jgi:hypothetical protein
MIGFFKKHNLWAPLQAIALTALGLFVPGSLVPAAETSEDKAVLTLEALPPPVEMRDFTVYIAEEGNVREEVHAEVAFLYETLSIAQLRNVHVDFLKEDSDEKETLDAPWGYLYLKDFVGPTSMTATHPFYEQLGGQQANIDVLLGIQTSESLAIGGRIPEQIIRRRKDIDLMGTLARPVIFRGSDGTEVRCLRAWRDDARGKVFGFLEFEMRTPMPKQNKIQVLTSDGVVMDDTISGKREINTRGKPYIRFEPMDKGPEPILPPM